MKYIPIVCERKLYGDRGLELIGLRKYEYCDICGETKYDVLSKLYSRGRQSSSPLKSTFLLGLANSVFTGVR